MVMKKHLFFIFVCFCVLTFLFPFYSDDCKFSEAQSINDCIERTVSFYNNWNGRIIPNFFCVLDCQLMAQLVVCDMDQCHNNMLCGINKESFREKNTISHNSGHVVFTSLTVTVR